MAIYFGDSKIQYKNENSFVVSSVVIDKEAREQIEELQERVKQLERELRKAGRGKWSRR